MSVQTSINRCRRHGHPPGEHSNYFNGECIWCAFEDLYQVRRELETANNKLMGHAYCSRHGLFREIEEALCPSCELETYREYVGNNMLRSDYRTVGDMRAALEAARAENKRLLKEQQDELDFYFKILDSCSNQRDALKADLAAAVELMKSMMDEKDGGIDEAWIKSFEGVVWVKKARAFLARMEGK